MQANSQVKFLHFKTEKQILLAQHRLKNTTTSIDEDFSPAMCIARKTLFEYGKNQSTVFQLRYDKLLINKK